MKAGLFVGLLAVAIIAPCIAGFDNLGIAGSDNPCCPACGCTCLQKVCKLVPDVKKETKITWSVECEDVCLQGHSRYCGEKCVPDPQARGGVRRETVWEPTCGRIVTRKKLKKHTETVEKPGCKCVVETVCKECGVCCTTDECARWSASGSPMP